jgi:hypothetical protein
MSESNTALLYSLVPAAGTRIENATVLPEGKLMIQELNPAGSFRTGVPVRLQKREA